MRKVVLIAALLSASPALAQQAQTAGDRIASQIGACLILAENQRDQIVDLQDKLSRALARVRELEPKPAEEKK